MNNNKIENKFCTCLGSDNVKLQEPMSKHTTFRIGGPADFYLCPHSTKEVQQTVQICKEENLPYFILGNGSNLLVSDKGYRGAIIQLWKNFSDISVKDCCITAKAGALLSKVAAEALEEGLTGMEFASGIPGTIGGAVFMNAGAYVTGSQLRRLGQYYAKAIHEQYGDDFDVLFGPAYKGIPLSVATTMAYSELYGKEIRYCSNRKEEKDHGDTGILLGSSLRDGDRVVIIEDVTTSGKSIEETFPLVKAQADVTVKGLMVSLNRCERGKGPKSALEEIRELYGFNANAIVSMEEVVEYLYNRPCQGRILIDERMKQAIDEYYALYGVK